MSAPDDKPNETMKQLFNTPLVEPKAGEDGVGSTLGQDVDGTGEKDGGPGGTRKDQGAGI